MDVSILINIDFDNDDGKDDGLTRGLISLPNIGRIHYIFNAIWELKMWIKRKWNSNNDSTKNNSQCFLLEIIYKSLSKSNFVFLTESLNIKQTNKPISLQNNHQLFEKKLIKFLSIMKYYFNFFYLFKRKKQIREVEGKINYHGSITKHTTDRNDDDDGGGDDEKVGELIIIIISSIISWSNI